MKFSTITKLLFPSTILALPQSNTQVPMSPTANNNTIYFGYGSNLWLHQMSIRCPEAQYLGIARLDNYKWIINSRGYANVVQVPPNSSSSSSSPPKYDNSVYGLVYSLSPTDESNLDKNEGVPVAYTKEWLPCSFWSAGAPSSPESPHSKIDTEARAPEEVDMLVYIDRKRVSEDEPRKEYVYRMNMGIKDALSVGVPEGYVEEVMRRFIREERGEGEVEALARRQALGFKDESGVF